MNVLITGAAGFVGRHLISLIGSKETTYGATLSEEGPGLLPVDLLDYNQVKRAINKINPDVIYHLAAYSSPALSFKEPAKAIDDSLHMQINIFEACLELKLKPTILVVSTGHIYGNAPADKLPLAEDAPVDLTTPYAVAKFSQEGLSNYYRHRGINSIISRAFNHTGPGQQPGFLVPDLACQIARLESKGGGVLKVGNLDSKRDFTDVRDIVRAYELLIKKGKPGEIYNVCSGRGLSGQEILDGLLKHTTIDIRVEQDPERMRPSDMPINYGDSSKVKNITGWEPIIPLEQTLADVMNDWRERIKQEKHA
ncbi:MAG TPA: GDP-mannose 4,6-dehydratase [Candidatus Dormibacteraeota bacterium]|nr:GDP-mannose 4,6-dehydratase [Candidatus Dormibacteraeota bacterium]